MKTISVYKNTNDKIGVHTSLDAVVSRIRSGENGLKDKTVKCRELAIGNDKLEYRKYKASHLPAVTFAGKFTSRDKAISIEKRLDKHSGLVILDYDYCDVASVMSEVSQMPSTVFAFPSPSAVGVKVVVRVSPIPKNSKEHKAAWHAVVERYSHIANADPSGSDVTRLCFLAYNPNAYFVDNLLDVDSVGWEYEQEQAREHKTSAADVDVSALDFIKSDVDYQDWLAVGMAIHDVRLDFSVWDSWSKQGDKYHLNYDGEMLSKWGGFTRGGGITWGTVAYMASENGWKPKAKINQEHKSTAADSDTSQFYHGKKFLPMGMHSYLLSQGNRYLSLSEEQGLRIYQDGIYIRERNVSREKRLLRSVQKALGGRHFKMSHYHEVRSMLLDDATPLSECDDTGFLCVKNGILNLDTLELEKHSPDRVFLTRLPIDFNSKAQCPAISNWLYDVLDGDQKQITLFLEAVGYTLLQTTELQKLFILEGPRDTGKSTAGKLLIALLGSNNVSNVSLHAIDNEDNRFQRVSLLGKIANISADISSRQLKGDGYVKAVVSGDEIAAESKGIDSFTFIPLATLWAMANKVPGSYDKTSGWYKRLCIIPFHKQFLVGSDTPPDTKMIDKLTTPAELSGLLTFSLLMSKEALARGAFTMSEKQVAAVEQIKERNDAVYGFIQSLDGNTEWEDKAFRELYESWCEDEQVKTLSKTKLKDACKTHGINWHRLGGGNTGRREVWRRDTEN